MKVLFIPTKKQVPINRKLISKLEKTLPKNFALFYSIQFKDAAQKIKSKLSNKKITLFQQVLGCSKPKIPKNTEGILLIGEGKFHAIGLALATNLPAYILDNTKLQKIASTEIEKLKKQKKASYMNYLHADNLGILVSTKPGQCRLKQAQGLKKQLEQNKKNVNIFISNNLSTSEFENFPHIECWINTACPRMDMESSKIINIGDLEF